MPNRLAHPLGMALPPLGNPEYATTNNDDLKFEKKEVNKLW